MDFIKTVIYPWFKRLELAFWRYPWMTFMVFGLLCFWFVYIPAVLMSSIWKGAVIVPILVVFGAAPLIYSCRIEGEKHSERQTEMERLKREIRELEGET